MLAEVMLLALELAGRRLMASHNRSVRGPVNRVPPWDVHTVISATKEDLDHLLQRAWMIPQQADVPAELLSTLDKHARIVLTAGIPHSRADLCMTLAAADCLPR
jgi:hypothetical protein